MHVAGTVGAAMAPTDSIDYFSRDHKLRSMASRVAYRARVKIFDRFVDVMQPGAADRIVDVGVTPDRELPDSNFFEQLYPHRDQITATSIEDASFLESDFPGVRFVRTDGASLPFADGEFDIAFSSAVLEHVGDRDAQRAFVAELVRVSKRFFLTTPNRWFPVEVHTFLPLLHWLPQPAHQRSLRALGKDFWAETDNLNLLSARTVAELFPAGSEVHVSRLRTAGATSNLLVWGSSPPGA